MKQEIRILGVDDGAFRFSDARCLLVGALTRGKHYIEAVLSQNITVDGFDSTESIIDMVMNAQQEQIRAIITDGITCGGCNVIDIHRIYEETEIGVIAVTRKQPQREDMRAVMQKLPRYKKRWGLVEKAGEPQQLTNDTPILYQQAGLTEQKAQYILRLTTENSYIPEPVRIAHVIASGMTKGISRGRV